MPAKPARGTLSLSLSPSTKINTVVAKEAAAAAPPSPPPRIYGGAEEKKRKAPSATISDASNIDNKTCSANQVSLIKLVNIEFYKRDYVLYLHIPLELVTCTLVILRLSSAGSPICTSSSLSLWRATLQYSSCFLSLRVLLDFRSRRPIGF